MIVADWISNFLVESGITHVYQLSGGMTAFLADSMARTSEIEIISLRHEQAAGFAAEGYSRVSGSPSVAMGTSGPGATNLMTAIASSYFDSIPVIFITGQVHQNEIKKNRFQRQNGFQELDIVKMSAGVTKYSRTIQSASEVSEIFNEALTMSTSGRPGPVLLDVPINIQQEEMHESFCGLDSPLKNQLTDFSNLLSMILNSKRPLILAGGGIRISKTTSQFINFLEKFQIPVVTSLMGIDSISSDYPLKIGMIGSYGNRWANRAIKQTDLLIVLGSRLDIRQTGADIRLFRDKKKIVRIDIDVAELGGRVECDYLYNASLEDFFDFMEEVDYKSNPLHLQLLYSVKKFSQEYPQENEQTSLEGINPTQLMTLISNSFNYSKGYVVDVGQHQMWAAQSIILRGDQRFLTSGGLGAMGFSIPASIGAWHAIPGKWITLLGDGCAQISMSEFQSLKSIQPNLAIIILNNRQQGMVAQFQEENLDSRYIGTRFGYSTPNFAKVADAFGIKSFQADSLIECREIFQKIRNLEEPVIIEIDIPQNAKALPKNAFGE